MTTSEGSSSDKSVLVEYTSSDCFWDVNQGERERFLKGIADYGNQFVYGRKSLNSIHGHNADKAIALNNYYGKEGVKANYVSSLMLVKITYQEILDLLDVANDIALRTKEGMEFVLRKMEETVLNRPSKWGLKPGTLRFFSNDLVCCWDGRNWVKINRKT